MLEEKMRDVVVVVVVVVRLFSNFYPRIRSSQRDCLGGCSVSYIPVLKYYSVTLEVISSQIILACDFWKKF